MSAADSEAKLVIHQLIETMHEFEKEWNSVYKDTYTYTEYEVERDHDEEESLKKRLDEIPIRIRSLLPKDPNLSEIDDLFIPSTNQETLSGIQYSGKLMTYFFKNTLKIYGGILTKVMFKRDSLDPIHRSTFIELILLAPCTETDIHKVEKYINDLIWLFFPIDWNITDAWLALKLLRVLCMKYKAYLNPRLGIKRLRDRIPWLMKLKDIPQAKSNEKQRLTSWISRQTAAILECLDCSLIYNDKHNFSFWTGDHETYVYNLMQHNEPSLEVLDYLHIYFMSSSDENQRVQLIKSFIRGCLRAFESESSHLYKQLRVQECYNLPEEVLFLTQFGELTKAFIFEWKSWDLDKYPVEKWVEFEKYYGKLEPYLAENRNNSCFLDDSSCQRINDKSKNTLEAENKEEPPDDLAIEKYIFFDGFLNKLHVLSILREALWKTADVLEMDEFPEAYEAVVFRTHSLKILNIYLTNPLDSNLRLNYDFGTRIYVAMKMCPFLFLSKHHEYLMEDLWKFLNGKVVDEATLDELYFAINCTPSWE